MSKVNHFFVDYFFALFGLEAPIAIVLSWARGG